MAASNAFPQPQVVSRTTREAGAISLGDVADVRLEPGLLAFLMTPVEAGDPPPGRGTHPMSGVPLGIAIEAAICAVDGKARGIDVLRACEIAFESHVRPDDVLRARAEVIAVGGKSVRLQVEIRAEQDDRLLLRGNVVLVRVVDGRAVALG